MIKIWGGDSVVPMVDCGSHSYIGTNGYKNSAHQFFIFWKVILFWVDLNKSTVIKKY